MDAIFNLTMSGNETQTSIFSLESATVDKGACICQGILQTTASITLKMFPSGDMLQTQKVSMTPLFYFNTRKHFNTSGDPTMIKLTTGDIPIATTCSTDMSTVRPVPTDNYAVTFYVNSYATFYINDDLTSNTNQDNLESYSLNEPFPTTHKYDLCNGMYCCVILKGNFSFTIPYEMENNKTSTLMIVVPDNAMVTGTCNLNNSNTAQEIDIDFFDGWKLSVVILESRANGEELQAGVDEGAAQF
ncbi:hypothetical protein MAR_025454 [Mya arenaria]|uniref:Uncharacterized protein n=1 Tax=Mya arenaria TaxID=6604 RepID=A0ABY7EQP4_MYAAR|nr:hypothetical protein MAR_025454 [Mya arenaria]